MVTYFQTRLPLFTINLLNTQNEEKRKEEQKKCVSYVYNTVAVIQPQSPILDGSLGVS